jgi:ATP-dependent helicase HrpB
MLPWCCLRQNSPVTRSAEHETETPGDLCYRVRRRMNDAALPIEGVVPLIAAAIEANDALVVQAEPGAGKTTRVPLVLLEHGVADRGEIVVAAPRRIAARLAAARVAQLLGEPLGKRVGYQVRFDTVGGPDTRIRFVTEGILMRRLRDDPQLRGVAAVVLDEFHERHIDTDLALALLRRLRRSHRPELQIVVMSATLDPDPVATYLSGRAVRCAGRAFPVSIEPSDRASERPLQAQVVAALSRLVDDGDGGSVLVFLPGVGEIRRTAEAVAPLARRHGFDVVELHGELPAAQQDRAVRPGPRPKVILATNVAETSVTVEDVTAVIDSGLARRPSHDAWSGIATLTLSKISRASADQRAGRAGRTRPGRCLRLYTRHDYDRRPAYDLPEIARLDLAGACLALRASGLRSADEIEWFERPPAASLEAAEALLHRLGAVMVDGGLTDVGRQMLRMPTHPRLARLLVEAQARGVPRLGASAAALLAERSISRRGHERSRRDVGAPSDVVAEIALLDEALHTPHGAVATIDRGACQLVDRVRKQLLRAMKSTRDDASDPEEALGLALLVAFPDRIGRCRHDRGGPVRVALAGGGEAELDPDSVVHGASFVVALAVDERKGGAHTARTIIRSAAHVEPEWLLELFPDRVEETVHVEFDESRGRVEAVQELRYDALVLDTTPMRELPPEATAVLREAASSRGAQSFLERPEDLDDLMARTAFVHAHDPKVPVIDDELVTEVLAALCEGRRSFAELRRADLLAHVLAALPPDARAALHRGAPPHVTLPGARRLKVHYELDRAPWVESRLQDFFGSTQGPHVAGVPLVLHLLAPNRRAVQVTTDLAGFWSRHYPELRRQLMRRYPKHDWPEDPAHAKPPQPRRTGRRRTD